MGESPYFTVLHIAIGKDGNVRLGSCLHCVTTRQRPPLSQRAFYHPEGQIDLDQEDLLREHDRLVRELATYGIQLTDSLFVPKDSMPRAEGSETTP